jgi:uncharacterized protein (DUF2132 family)
MQVNALVDRYGWAELAQRININCFKMNRALNQFEVSAPYAVGTGEVEALYLDST